MRFLKHNLKKFRTLHFLSYFYYCFQAAPKINTIFHYEKSARADLLTSRRAALLGAPRAAPPHASKAIEGSKGAAVSAARSASVSRGSGLFSTICLRFRPICQNCAARRRSRALTGSSGSQATATRNKSLKWAKSRRPLPVAARSSHCC